MTRVAIMQPYVFPYLGYYQLLHAADRFVCFDDVNFIKKGWINRNRILLNGAAYTFTIPIAGASQNNTIRQSIIAEDVSWKPKLLTNITHAYRKASCFAEVFPAVENLVTEAQGSIADMAEASLRLVVERAGLAVSIHRSSELGLPEDLRAQERIIAVAKAHGASTYINPANGAELYDPGRFADSGMDLRFLRMDKDVTYPQQGNADFEPHLSTLDALMNCSAAELSALLNRYTLSTKHEL
jgi:hypothetical protein